MAKKNIINEKIMQVIKKRVGENASAAQMSNYLESLTMEDFMHMVFEVEGNLTEDESKLLADEHYCDGHYDGNDDGDDTDGYDTDGYDNNEDCHHEPSGSLECMPVLTLKKYTLRVKLRGISPSIWRKIEVPSSVKLTSLAEIILTAMGWYNEHLHQFFTKGRQECYATAQKEEDDFMEFGRRTLWGGDYPISHLLQKEKDKVTFEYDYGDSWEHEVTLSKVEDYAKDERPEVRLIGGKRACPPENCGGVWGYQELCEAMKHPRSARARELKEWLGYKYDPEEFWLDEAQEDVDAFNY